MFIRTMIYDTTPQIVVHIDESDAHNIIPLANEYENWFANETDVDVRPIIDCNSTEIKIKILSEHYTADLIIAFKLRFA